MRKNKLAVVGLSFALAVGCSAVAVSKLSGTYSASADAESMNTYVYSIENITKDTLYEVNFVNDFFGCSAPYQYTALGNTEDYATPAGKRMNVVYTYDACYNEKTQKAEVTVDTIYFKGQDQYMVVSPDGDTGDYKVDSITKIANTETSFTFEIPEGGYVVLTTTGAAGLANSFAEGDIVSGIIDQSDWELKNISSDYEYSLKLTHAVTASGDATPYINYNCSILNRTAGATVTAYKTRSYFVAEYSVEDSAYEVTRVIARGTSTELTANETLTVPKNGFIVALGGYYMGSGVYASQNTQANPMYYRGGFVDSLEVGSLLSFTDRTLSFDLDLTVTNDGVATKVDAVNECSVETVGKTVIYGISGNSGFVNTPNRLDENLKEYAVLVAGEEHKVIDIYDGKENPIPAHGYVISSATDLGWKIGDIVTLSNDTTVNVYDNTVDFAATNQRLRLWGVDQPLVGNSIRLYTPNYSNLDENGKPIVEKHGWCTEVTCEYGEDGVAKVVKTESRTETTAVTPIPENGFVVYSHSKELVGYLKVLNVGDTVIVNDWKAESSVAIKSITQGEDVIYEFNIGENYASIVLDEGTDMEAYVNALQFNKLYEGMTITVEPCTAYTLPMELTVNVVSQNGYFEEAYTIAFVRKLSKDASLASLSINGTALEDFATATKTYSYKYVIGGEIPTVSAVATDTKATVSVEQATEQNKQAVITVTAEDNSYVWTYKVVFTVVDNTLKELYIGSTKLSTFDPNTLTYEYKHSFESAPKLTAVANDKNANITYVQAFDKDGTATIIVACDGFEKTYTVKFVSQVANAGNADKGGCKSSISSLAVFGTLSAMAVALFVKRREE